jgi:hypothetical protein
MTTNQIKLEKRFHGTFWYIRRFGVFINGFNDGQQDFQFLSTLLMDRLHNDRYQRRDYSWDAIWKSKAIITNFGWVVEMRIPYAALRFSAEKNKLGVLISFGK